MNPGTRFKEFTINPEKEALRADPSLKKAPAESSWWTLDRYVSDRAAFQAKAASLQPQQSFPFATAVHGIEDEA